MLAIRGRPLAWWVSIAFHPFVLMPLLLLWLLGRSMSPARALTLTLLIAGITILPALLLIRSRVRRGSWSDHDVSSRKERPLFYGVAVALVLLAALVLHYSGEFAVARGAWNVAGMLAVAAVVNLAVKASLHSAFAMWGAVILFNIDPSRGMIALPIVAVLAWSRVALERHTPLEVAAGLAIGAGAALILVR